MGIKRNDCILLPEYICDVVLHPLEELGLKHTYYSVDDALAPNWNELESLVNNRTKAILMIHFFGQPQNIYEFRSFCKRHSLLLIEDNAHGHGGMLDGQLLGTFGDLGISSPRKILNTYSGGILWLKNKKFTYPSNLQPYSVSTSRYIKRNIFGHYPNVKNFVKKKLQTKPQYEDPRAFRETTIKDYSIDKRSKKIIKQTNWNKLRKVRYEAYQRWHRYAFDNNLIPVFENLHPESNPWCFPAYTNNQQERIQWFDWGWKNNIQIFSWPSLPEEILYKRSKSLNRWKKLICFGIE